MLGTIEQKITLLMGLSLAIFQLIVLITVYGKAIANNSINWVNSTDVSVSKSLALLGTQGPIVSIIVLFSSTIFGIICYRQNLIFPLLPLLYAIGSVAFAILPIITMDVSEIGHSIATLIFLILFFVGIVLTTRKYKQYDKTIPLIAMNVIDWIALAGFICSFAAVLYGMSVKDSSGEMETQLFTCGEFIMGLVFFTWLIIISLPIAKLPINDVTTSTIH